MTTAYNFTSTIKDVQNRIVASTIKEVSNLDLLKSEEAIVDVIKSYTDRFKAIEGMLTDVSKYVVESKTVVKLSEFNKLFESLYIDIAALYHDLEIVDNVLTLNLNRNKNYFLIIKKRVRDLWQRLELTRSQVYDLSPSDESFYESFYSSVNSVFTSNIEVDKKNGFLSLVAKRRRLLNDLPYIKSVTSVTYPVENEDGGVIFTTSPLNDFNENYSNGSMDLLSDGLWKEQVFCKDIPNMIIDIGLVDGDGEPVRRNYKGIVSIVDIEYAYPVEINRLDVDVFGEKSLDIDCILYKTASSDNWKIAKFEADDPMDSLNPVSSIRHNSVAGRAFDIISFMNITKIKAMYLRVVFNQQNYSLLDSDELPERTIEQQIEKDLEERRYELVKFNASISEELVAPVNEDNRSLYSKINSIIESTRNIEDILNRINKVLVPEISTLTTSFSKAALFEIGAWSIEPMIEEYTRLIGKYDSKIYKIRDRSLISAQIKADQHIPNATTCNWYLNVNGKDIPVLENDASVRKEPINFLNKSELNPSYSTWTGSFILLDFPVDPSRADSIGIYENGTFDYQFSTKIAFLNSRLLYLHGLTDPAMAEYVIRYPVARYNCTNVYVLNSKTGVVNVSPISLGIVSTRREVLEVFSKTARSLVDLSDSSDSALISENYTISNALATFEECEIWFGSTFSSCLFIDETIKAYLDLSNIGPIASILSSSISKFSSTSTDIETYYQGAGIGPSDFSILSLYPGLAPLSNKRII